MENESETSTAVCGNAAAVYRMPWCFIALHCVNSCRLQDKVRCKSAMFMNYVMFVRVVFSVQLTSKCELH